jgi:hypothetical protein
MQTPGNVISRQNKNRPGVEPRLSPREEQIVRYLSTCRAFFRTSLEGFWSSPSRNWQPTAKGKKKIGDLLYFGVLWSWKLGDKEIITLSPFFKHLAGGAFYIPDDPRDALRTVLASELFLRVSRNVPCEFAAAKLPLQGILTAKGAPVNVMALLPGDIIPDMKDRCFVICRNMAHVTELSKKIKFSPLFITHDLLLDWTIDIAYAFCDRALVEMPLAIFVAESIAEPTAGESSPATV